MRGKIRKSVEELIAVKDYDEEMACFLMEDGYMDILKIVSKDLINSSSDEVEYDCLKFAKLYRIYGDDQKIITMNFPCNTEKQQQFLEYKMNHTGNGVYKKLLQRKLNELAWLGKHDTTREYYFMLFAKKPEEMEKNRLTIQSTLGQGKTGLLEILSKEKKIRILERMANKCLLMQ